MAVITVLSITSVVVRAQQSLYRIRLQDASSHALTIDGPTGGFAANWTFRFPSNVTSAGSLLYASDALGQTGWVTPGSIGQVLTVTPGGVPAWVTPTLGTITSIGMTVPSGLSVSPGLITSTGTFAITTTLNGVIHGNGSGFTAGNVALGSEVSGTLAIANGGTGAITANAALNNLLPTQTGNSGKFLQTDGTNTSWVAGNSGTVTSVGLSMPSIFTVTNSPVTTSGTLTATLANEAQNSVFAGPTSGSGSPSFRALVAGDIPNLSSSYISNSTALQASSNYHISGNGEIEGQLQLKGTGTGLTTFHAGAQGATDINYTLPITAPTNGQVLTSTAAGVMSWANAATGTVTSVGLTMPTGFSVANSPVTSSGTLAVTTTLNGVIHGNGSGFTAGNVALGSEVSGTLGIANGGTGATTANAALNNLLPTQTGNTGKVLQTDGTNTSWVAASTGTVTSVGLSMPSIFTVTNSPVTTSGTLTATLANEAQNTVFAGPTSGSGAPTFRALVAADLNGAAWSLSGNSGTTAGTNFIGTTDSTAFEIHLYNSDATANRGSKRVLRISPHGISPNFLGGYQGNTAGGTGSTGVFGATIVGGGSNGQANAVRDNFGFVGGGAFNRAGSLNADSTDAQYAAVVGGIANQASGAESFVGGGNTNQATGADAAVGGGANDVASGANSFVGGGGTNTASAQYSAILGGSSNSALGIGTAILGGSANQAGTNSGGDYTSVLGGKGLLLNAAGSTGFLGNNSSGLNNMTVTSNNTAVLGNVDLWLANNDNSAGQLRFYEAQNTNGAFPAAGTNYTAFQAGAQSADIIYTLPITAPTNGQVLTSTAGGVMSWSNAAAGTVTSVGLTMPTGFSVANSPITSSGTLAVTTTLNGVIHGNGSGFTAGNVALGSEVSGTLGIANGGTGATTANAALNNLLPTQTGNTGKVLQTDGTNTSWVAASTGTVTSVGLSMPSIFTVTNSPVTTSGTLTASLATQNANLVFAGPTTGIATAPTFRALVAADIPSLAASYIVNGTSLQSSSNFHISGNGEVEGQLQLKGTSTGITTFAAGAQGASNINYTLPTAAPTSNGQVLSSTTAGVMSWATVGTGSVTSVGLSMPSIFSVTNSPVTTSGTLTASLANQNANLVFAGPTTGAAAAPGFRALVAADMPDLSSSYIDNGTALQPSSNFHISGNGQVEGQLQLKGTSTGITTFQAGAQGATNINYTLPITAPTNGQVLSSTAAGVLSWVNAGGSGTVTSVGLTMPTGFSVANSPVTSSGTLAVTTSLNGVIHGNGSGFTAGNVALGSEVSGTLGVTNGGTGTSTQFTPGSVIFAGTSGVYTQNNATFFWDNSNNQLGIGTNNPNVSLDVVKDFATREYNYTTSLSGTTNNNMNFDGAGNLFGLVRLQSASGAFTITSIAGPQNGKRITLYNASTQTMTIANQSAAAGATAANKIITGSGADVKITPSGSIDLVYSATDSRWIMVSNNTTSITLPIGDVVQATPSDPTGTTSSTGKMMGLGSSVTITPSKSGTIMIVISGSENNTTGGNGGSMQICYGTGTAPTNGANPAGTAVGNLAIGSPSDPNGANNASHHETIPMTCNAIVSGLTVGTTYWIDIKVAVIGGAGTSKIQGISVSAIEL